MPIIHMGLKAIKNALSSMSQPSLLIRLHRGIHMGIQDPSEQTKAGNHDSKAYWTSSTGLTKILQSLPPMDSSLSKSSKESRFFVFLIDDLFDHPNGAKMNININFFYNTMRVPKSNLDF